MSLWRRVRCTIAGDAPESAGAVPSPCLNACNPALCVGMPNFLRMGCSPNFTTFARLHGRPLRLGNSRCAWAMSNKTLGYLLTIVDRSCLLDSQSDQFPEFEFLIQGVFRFSSLPEKYIRTRPRPQYITQSCVGIASGYRCHTISIAFRNKIQVKLEKRSGKAPQRCLSHLKLVTLGGITVEMIHRKI